MPGYAKPPGFNSNNISITPVGNISSTILQEGIAELDSEKNAKNLLYNGAMQVAQRGTSTTGITTFGYYTADRWLFDVSAMGTWTQTLENDAPTGSGFRKSIKVLCTTADASPSAGDLVGIQQRIEGQDLQRVAKGTASARQLTLSFWVKSNVTGTYISELYDIDNTRQISAAYTISASATWEKKTVTFAADTSGVWDNDNAVSLYVVHWLGAGSNFTSGTLNTSWASATNANRAVGQVNLAAATNNYWQVTGVQLEVGEVASPFDFKSYGQDLAECQRYFCKTASQGVDPKQNNGDFSSLYVVGQVNGVLTSVIWKFPVTMRAAPTVTTFSPNAATSNWSANPNPPAATVANANTEMAVIQAGPTNISAGNAHYLSAQAAIEL